MGNTVRMAGGDRLANLGGPSWQMKLCSALPRGPKASSLTNLYFKETPIEKVNLCSRLYPR